MCLFKYSGFSHDVLINIKNVYLFWIIDESISLNVRQVATGDFEDDWAWREKSIKDNNENGWLNPV